MAGDDRKLKELADSMWGPGPMSKSGEKRLGQGRLLWGQMPGEVLQTLNLPPDVEVRNLPKQLDPKNVRKEEKVRWGHRHAGGTDMYFVVNHAEAERTFTAVFRVAGRKPEFFDPVTGDIRALPECTVESGRTAVPLRMAPFQSGFVVFRPGSEAAAARHGKNFPELKPVLDLSESWQVSFDPKLGGPKDPVQFTKLEDWTMRPEDGIKHYSGMAVYRKTFDAPHIPADKPLYLDLGNVKSLAEVAINGKELGVIWCHPMRVAVPAGLLRAKDNQVEIRPVNPWNNRIIGDGLLPPEKKVLKYQGTASTFLPPEAKYHLMPAGLMGPVRVMAEDQNTIEARKETNMKTNSSKSRGILVSTLLIGTMLWSNLAGAEEDAAMPEPLPTLTVKPLPVAKAKFHRYTNLRSGQIKTARGWNVQDWAMQAYNPNAKTIELTWKLIADDPNFVYRDGRKGTWTKLFKLGAMRGEGGNVAGLLSPDYPIPSGTNWTGVTEFSSSEPFYVYILAPTPIVEGPDALLACRKGWFLWSDEVSVLWDKELKQFVSPYTNYWHNDCGQWFGGWHTRLILVNRSDKNVSYTLEHRPFYGNHSSYTTPKITGFFQDQKAAIDLKPGQRADVYLEDVFGWHKDWLSAMEGALRITPNPLDAWEKTEVKLYIPPGKTAVESLKAREKQALSDATGIVVQPKDAQP